MNDEPEWFVSSEELEAPPVSCVADVVAGKEPLWAVGAESRVLGHVPDPGRER